MTWTFVRLIHWLELTKGEKGPVRCVHQIENTPLIFKGLIQTSEIADGAPRPQKTNGRFKKKYDFVSFETKSFFFGQKRFGMVNVNLFNILSTHK